MKFRFLSRLLLCILPTISFSCSKQESRKNVEEEGKIPIYLCTSISTKATETSFENNDKVGLYVVNFAGGSHGQLATSGNHINNEVFVYDGNKWSSSKELYWKDNITHADFYCYFPYSAVSDVHKVPFQVATDQSSIESLNGSDFLWGRTMDVAPSEKPVEIEVSHRVTKVVINIKPGKGYTEEALASKDIGVSLCDFYTNATVDISSGIATATGAKNNISLYRSDNCWLGHVIPQEITDANVVKVVIDGSEYYLKRTVSFVANKSQECTLTIDRTGEGVNIGISDWENDGTDFGGTLN